MAFATIDVTKGITGTIPVANGGTGLASGTTDQFLKFTGTTTLASSAVDAGKILQVVNATDGGNSTANTTNTSFTTAETLGTTITVTKGNKVLFFANSIQWKNTGTNNYNGVLRVSLSDGSNTATTNEIILQNQNASINIIRMYGTSHAGLLTTASGSGTVAVTATVQFKAENSSENHVYYGDTNTESSFAYTFMEISV
jgi:hypothetical protein